MKFKNSSKNVQLISLFLAILTLLIFISLFEYKKTAPTRSPQHCKDRNCDFLSEQKMMEEELKAKEPSIVYANILSRYEKSSPNDQHSIAHIFGEVLYKLKGNASITVCDDSFAYGCFHGFFMNAISNEGIGAIKQFDEMCIKKFGEYDTGCQHGIGHGIAEYLGPQNLDRSLDACATLTWKHKLMGCSGGVFMEYLLPSFSKNASGLTISPINWDKPFKPCDTVNKNFAPECFYNLGNYYYYALSKDSERALKLCDTVSESLDRKSCFLGVGDSIYSKIRDITKTIQQCRLGPNKESEISCRAGAAWYLYASEIYRSEAKKFCENLNTLDFEKCQKDSDLLNLAIQN